jgi:hypothetical protein
MALPEGNGASFYIICLCFGAACLTEFLQLTLFYFALVSAIYL